MVSLKSVNELLNQSNPKDFESKEFNEAVADATVNEPKLLSHLTSAIDILYRNDIQGADYEQS